MSEQHPFPASSSLSPHVLQQPSKEYSTDYTFPPKAKSRSATAALNDLDTTTSTTISTTPSISNKLPLSHAIVSAAEAVAPTLQQEQLGQQHLLHQRPHELLTNSKQLADIHESDPMTKGDKHNTQPGNLGEGEMGGLSHSSSLPVFGGTQNSNRSIMSSTSNNNCSSSIVANPRDKSASQTTPLQHYASSSVTSRSPSLPFASPTSASSYPYNISSPSSSASSSASSSSSSSSFSPTMALDDLLLLLSSLNRLNDTGKLTPSLLSKQIQKAIHTVHSIQSSPLVRSAFISSALSASLALRRSRSSSLLDKEVDHWIEREYPTPTQQQTTRRFSASTSHTDPTHHTQHTLSHSLLHDTHHTLHNNYYYPTRRQQQHVLSPRAKPSMSRALPVSPSNTQVSQNSSMSSPVDSHGPPLASASVLFPPVAAVTESPSSAASSSSSPSCSRLCNLSSSHLPRVDGVVPECELVALLTEEKWQSSQFQSQPQTQSQPHSPSSSQSNIRSFATSGTAVWSSLRTLRVSDPLRALLLSVEDWVGFDVFHVSAQCPGRVLCSVFLYLADNRLGLFDELPLDRETVARYLVAIEDGYRPTNPYHNALHAADVLRATYFFLTRSIFSARDASAPGSLPATHIFASLLAAAIHDYAHPAFLLMSSPSLDVLSGFPPSMRASMRSLIVQQSLNTTPRVLNTDMSSHFKNLADLQAESPPAVKGSRDLSSIATPKQQLSHTTSPPPSSSIHVFPLRYSKPGNTETFFHFREDLEQGDFQGPASKEEAQASHQEPAPTGAPAARPLENGQSPIQHPQHHETGQEQEKAGEGDGQPDGEDGGGDDGGDERNNEEEEERRRWTDRLVREFYEQGDLERALGIPVSAMMDRRQPNVERSQSAFIDVIVSPLLLTAQTFMKQGTIQPAIDCLQINRLHWRHTTS